MLVTQSGRTLEQIVVSVQKVSDIIAGRQGRGHAVVPQFGGHIFGGHVLLRGAAAAPAQSVASQVIHMGANGMGDVRLDRARVGTFARCPSGQNQQQTTNAKNYLPGQGFHGG